MAEADVVEELSPCGHGLENTVGTLPEQCFVFFTADSDNPLNDTFLGAPDAEVVARVDFKKQAVHHKHAAVRHELTMEKTDLMAVDVAVEELASRSLGSESYSWIKMTVNSSPAMMTVMTYSERMYLQTVQII